MLAQEVAPTAMTLRSLDDSAVRLEMQDMGAGSGTEFRVRVKTQKADDIHVPDDAQAVAKRPAPAKPKERPGPNPAVWAVLVLGLAAGGALVYFGVSATRATPPS